MGTFAGLSGKRLYAQGVERQGKLAPEMTGSVTKRGKVLGALSLSLRWERYMCRGRKGGGGAHVLAGHLLVGVAIFQSWG